jgi:hypothetical protein
VDAWPAFVVSVVAVVVSIASVLYARRQARAAEDSAWIGQPLEFTAEVARPHSAAAPLRLSYVRGAEQDGLAVDITNTADGPMSGFGPGMPVGTTWEIGAARVGDRPTAAIVQRFSQESGRSEWQGGTVRLRAHCTRGRHMTDVALAVDVPFPARAY